MSTTQTLVLGAIAGLTIFLGCRCRMQNVTPATKAFLAATATGILIFLFWDVMSGAVGPFETALEEGRTGRFAWLAFLLTAGFFVGLMSLVYYDTWISAGAGERSSGRAPRPLPSSSMTTTSPGCRLHAGWRSSSLQDSGCQLLRRPGDQQSAASDQVSLAIVLIIGFGLTTQRKGGIRAPLAGDKERPSWAFLGLLGLIGGGPTFFGPRRRVLGDELDPVLRARRRIDPLRGDGLLNVGRVFASNSSRPGESSRLVLGFGTDFILVAAGVSAPTRL